MRIKAISWSGDRVSDEVREAGIEGIGEALEYLLQEANKIVPLDESSLEKSGGTDVDKDKMNGSVFYDQIYGPRLHEHPEYKFQKGREGKWLEKTIKEKGDKANNYVKDKIQDALRR